VSDKRVSEPGTFTIEGGEGQFSEESKSLDSFYVGTPQAGAPMTGTPAAMYASPAEDPADFED
jgi:hypothetical protein